MSRWTDDPGSEPEYCNGLGRMRRQSPAKVCCWCEPHHEIQAGSYPASHGMCPAAAARQMALIDAEEAAKRQQGTA